MLVKQDINFLDKPLWMVNVRNDGMGMVWEDINNYKYRTGYKMPDKVDMLILLYLLHKSQKQDYDNKLKVTRYEVLKACKISPNPEYYKRLEDSLRRWKNITLEFKGSFYSKGKHLTISFGIIDSYEINEKKKLLKVDFNENWLLRIKESDFCKNINFEYYRRLKRSVSRRLYELLAKNFKGRVECHYKLTTLGARLTLSGRKNKKGEETIYASDVLVAIKPAINEINKLAGTPEISKITGIPEEDIFVIKYKITGKGQERVIHFCREAVSKKKTPKIKKKPTEEVTSRGQEEFNFETERTEVSKQYQTALDWIESIPYFNKKRKQEIWEMEKEEIEKVYVGIRREYERLEKEGKKPKVGWVYKAFTEKWEFSEKLEEDKKEEIKAKIEEMIAKKKAEVKKYIEKSGGVEKIRYNEKKIEVMEDYGLYIIEENALEAWNDVNLKLLKNLER